MEENTTTDRDLYGPRIFRLIKSLDEELKTVPPGYRRPFNIIEEILIELADTSR